MFSTVGAIVGSKIESKRSFSVVKILINLKRCRLQSKNLEIFLFINKNWPNDCKFGCKSPSSLVKFIDADGDSKKKLEEFEGFF
jgi:hypothetical protein